MEKVQKSDSEWREQLTDEQYEVTRKAGTERAFTGAYWDTKTRAPTAASAAAELFDSETKFDSGTGWPSFFRARRRRAPSSCAGQQPASCAAPRSSAAAATPTSATSSTTARRRPASATASTRRRSSSTRATARRRRELIRAGWGRRAGRAASLVRSGYAPPDGDLRPRRLAQLVSDRHRPADRRGGDRLHLLRGADRARLLRGGDRRRGRRQPRAAARRPDHRRPAVARLPAARSCSTTCSRPARRRARTCRACSAAARWLSSGSTPTPARSGSATTSGPRARSRRTS